MVTSLLVRALCVEQPFEFKKCQTTRRRPKPDLRKHTLRFNPLVFFCVFLLVFLVPGRHFFKSMCLNKSSSWCQKDKQQHKKVLSWHNSASRDRTKMISWQDLSCKLPSAFKLTSCTLTSVGKACCFENCDLET